MRGVVKTLLLILVVFAQIEAAFCCANATISERTSAEIEKWKSNSDDCQASDTSLPPDFSQSHMCQHSHAFVVDSTFQPTRFKFKESSLSLGFQAFLPESRSDLPWQPPRSI